MSKRKKIWLLIFGVLSLMFIALVFFKMRTNSQSEAISWVEEQGGSLQLQETSSLMSTMPDFIKYMVSYFEKVSAVIINNPEVKEIDTIRDFEELQFLDLSYTSIENLQNLDTLKKLEYLDISNTRVSSLHFLQNLPNLKTLKIVGTPIADYSPLLKCQSLIEIYMSSFDDKESIQRMLPNCQIIFSDGF